jgi:protein MAK11
MAKRKRQTATNGEATIVSESSKKIKAAESTPNNASRAFETVQVVVGSYDRVLHGLTATIGPKGKGKDKKQPVQFADTFLFNAHSSMIRCVAVSPPSEPRPGQGQKVFLASGSTDERINVYDLSAHPPSARSSQAQVPQVAPRPILENRRNRELGTLLHHASTVTALSFPSRAKLFSSSDDLAIAATRTRDWTLLSSMKSARPKVLGRPSGDTAAFGGTPAGVNDFAIHPSMKVMISVNKAERCLRLWDVTKGKKSNVLDFKRDLLREVGEGRHATGEGRRIVWGSVAGEDEFAVGFDRNILVFGMDSEAKCRVMSTNTKVHQISYVPLEDADGTSLLAVSTEDGRVIFYSTDPKHLAPPSKPTPANTTASSSSSVREPTLSVAKPVGYVGGKDQGVSGRIKDFVCLHSAEDPNLIYVVAGSSDGTVRLWTVGVDDLQQGLVAELKKENKDGLAVGALAGTYKTHDRITCMAAFLMIPRPEGLEDSDDELEEEKDEDEEASADEEEDDDDE